MKRLNCWQFKRCGREQGGTRAAELGVCPASIEVNLDRAHGGSNAGRACWVVGGTLCKGVVQGTFARKYDNCTKCDFYERVRNEEGSSFVLSATLLSRLRAAV